MRPYPRLFKDERAFQAVFGISPDHFRNLSGEFEKRFLRTFERPGRKRAPGAGRRSEIPDGEDKLAFILFYIKVHPTLELMSVFWGLNRSECCRWVHRLLPILAETLGRRLHLPKRKIHSIEEFRVAFPHVCEVFPDDAERPVQSPRGKAEKPKARSAFHLGMPSTSSA